MRALAMFQRYPFRQSPTWSWQRETKRAFGAVMAPSQLGRYLISRMQASASRSEAPPPESPQRPKPQASWRRRSRRTGAGTISHALVFPSPEPSDRGGSFPFGARGLPTRRAVRTTTGEGTAAWTRCKKG
jgi:hypothetical protein